MKLRLMAGALALAWATTVSAMPVSTFLVKAGALQKKGPLALFSGDLKLLMNQVKGDFGALRAERLAAKSAGRPTSFCPPEGGVKMSDRDIMTAMQAVPPAQRATTDTRSALRAYMARRFPCRG